MTGAIKELTDNFSFNIINYDFPRWNTYEWTNWRLLDGVLASLTGGIIFKGEWANNTSYLVGDRIYDPVTGFVYYNQVAHTSAASGTFEDDRIANPTYWRNSVEVPIFRGDWGPGQYYNKNDIVFVNNNEYYFCVVAHTSSADFTTDATKWVLLFSFAGLLNVLDYRTECRLDYVSSTTIKLTPYNGNKLTIGSAIYAIPSAGVSLVSPTMTPNQIYYIYAYMAGSVMTLEAANIPYSVNPDTGIQTKTGDTSRTLVGLVVASSTGTFEYANPTYKVCSWYNKQLRVSRVALSSDFTSGTSTGNEKITGLGVRCAAFINDPIVVSLNAYARMSSSGSADLFTTGLSFGNPAPYPIRSSTVVGANLRTARINTNPVVIIESWLNLSGNSAVVEGGTVAGLLDKTVLTVETLG